MRPSPLNRLGLLCRRLCWAIEDQLFKLPPLWRWLGYGMAIILLACCMAGPAVKVMVPDQWQSVLHYRISEAPNQSTPVQTGFDPLPAPGADPYLQAALPDHLKTASPAIQEAVGFIIQMQLPELLDIDMKPQFMLRWPFSQLPLLNQLTGHSPYVSLKPSLYAASGSDNRHGETRLSIHLSSTDPKKLAETSRQFDRFFQSSLNEINTHTLINRQEQLYERLAEAQADLMLMHDLDRNPNLLPPEQPALSAEETISHLKGQYETVVKQLNQLDAALAKAKSKQQYFERLLNQTDSRPYALSPLVKEIRLSDGLFMPPPAANAKAVDLAQLTATSPLLPSQQLEPILPPSALPGALIKEGNLAVSTLTEDMITLRLATEVNQKAYDALNRHKEQLLKALESAVAKQQHQSNSTFDTRETLILKTIETLDTQLRLLESQLKKAQSSPPAMVRLNPSLSIEPANSNTVPVPWWFTGALGLLCAATLSLVPLVLEHQYRHKAALTMVGWAQQHRLPSLWRWLQPRLYGYVYQYWPENAHVLKPKPLRHCVLVLPYEAMAHLASVPPPSFHNHLQRDWPLNLPAHGQPKSSEATAPTVASMLGGLLQQYGRQTLVVDMDFETQHLSQQLSHTAGYAGLFARLRHPDRPWDFARHPQTHVQVLHLEQPLRDRQHTHIPSILRRLRLLLNRQPFDTILLDCPRWHAGLSTVVPAIDEILLYCPKPGRQTPNGATAVDPAVVRKAARYFKRPVSVMACPDTTWMPPPRQPVIQTTPTPFGTPTSTTATTGSSIARYWPGQATAL
ncbi:MAG: hypothetical protein KC475_05445 [Cyanobacteria bacterium HKST-UBA03]|nr:hypothetical protein [Cyanobacteria bacterium HKST-UBA03]